MDSFAVKITTDSSGNAEQMRQFDKQLEQFMRQRGFNCVNKQVEGSLTHTCYEHYKFTTTIHKR